LTVFLFLSYAQELLLDMSLTFILYVILKIMVLGKNHRPRRGNSTAKRLIALIVLLVIGFSGVWYVHAQNKVTNSKGQMTGVKQVVVTPNLDQSAWKNLRDQDNTFEIKYPKDIFKRTCNQITVPLPSQEKIKAVGLVHSVAVRHCGLSGLPEHCSATTTDIAIDFFTVSRNFNDVFKDLQKSYGQDMLIATYDGHQGVRFTIGAEGEGVVYTILPLNSAKTLFIMRSYVSEEFDIIYKETPGFIKYSDQKVLFEQIMSTLTFRPSI